MAGLTAEAAEINTIITMLGCLCATVQAATGYYAGYRKKKVGLLKTNDILFRSPFYTCKNLLIYIYSS